MKIQKMVAALLTPLIVLAAVVPLHANADSYVKCGEITPYYEYFSGVRAGLSIEANGYAICSGEIDIYVNYDSEITITLQRSNDGRSWSDVRSWSQAFSGTGSYKLEKGYYVNSGYTYRVLNTARVKRGSTVLETATVYSPEREY